MTWLQKKDIDAEIGHRCPVTGLPIRRRPEWIDVNFGQAFSITLCILGDNILFVRPSGYGTLSDIQHTVRLIEKVEAEAISEDAVYIRIADWSNLTGISKAARKYYIEYIKKRDRSFELILFGLPSMFKIAVSLVKRFNILKFNSHVVNDYSNALKLAQKILSGSQTKTGGDSAKAAPRHPRSAQKKESSHRVVAHPDWYFHTENFSLGYEVINGNILHGHTTGRFEKEHIKPAFRMKEAIIKSIWSSVGGYYYILGLNESEGTGQKTRKLYVNAILELYRKYPFKIFIFYGANKFLKAGINLARPFVPFKVRVVKDLDRALTLITKESNKSLSPLRIIASQNSSRPAVSPNNIQQYVNELLSFLEGINWEVSGTSKNNETDPSHPFRPVFDAINLVKWELDDLYREQKRVEEELKQARDAAESSNRSKSEFLANMSHELRTPLNHIIGFTELVVDKKFGELNAVQNEHLNDVLQSSRHLLELINDILDLSKVEAGKLELQLTEVNLKELLENSITMIKDKAVKQGLKMVTDTSGVLESINADERKLKQIIYNLLSNAVKFTPKEGGSIRLTAKMGNQQPISVYENGDEENGIWIEISVKDTGIGMNQDCLERIFKPFEQADNSSSRRYQGTGLGLSLTKNLVELHGGKIWAESPGEGLGSTFTFIMPVR